MGVFTGSLGIISEALHSGLDLVATVITFLAIRFSDKPADAQHHYGHGKMESFSALIETILLLITCIWIIYEAIQKLFFGKSSATNGAIWGAVVMVISIIVDSTRVGILKRTAKKYGSQALEADALHFSSDILSSAVVCGGLVCVWIGEIFHIPALKYADPIAALGVAALVIRVSMKLGKETIDVLLDTAPKGMKEAIEKEISTIANIVQIESVRIRPSGAVKYIDLNIGVESVQDNLSVHKLVSEIKNRVSKLVPNSDVVVSTFPIESLSVEDVNINRTLVKIVGQVPNCLNVHNVHIYELDGKKEITAHIELKENLTLSATHELSHEISKRIKKEIDSIENVNLFFERAEPELRIEDITEFATDIVCSIKEVVNGISDDMDCHEIRIYKKGDKVSTFLHCGVREEFTVDKLELLSDDIKRKLKSNVNHLENVHIHFEPLEDS